MNGNENILKDGEMSTMLEQGTAQWSGTKLELMCPDKELVFIGLHIQED